MTRTWSNQRVEMNRHQPSCLSGLFDSMTVTLHSNVLGQVAVTHPGRSGTPRHVAGYSIAENLVCFRGVGFGRGFGRSAANAVRPLVHGWRRLDETRVVERGTVPLLEEDALGDIGLESSRVGWRSSRTKGSR